MAEEQERSHQLQALIAFFIRWLLAIDDTACPGSSVLSITGDGQGPRRSFPEQLPPPH